MQEPRVVGGKLWTARQASELIQDFFEKVWPKMEPILADPQRKQILQSVSGLVGRTLADTDFSTGEFLYPHIREWIDKQRPGYAWREVKDKSGNSFIAPSDEDAIIAIANACMLPREIPVPLPAEEAKRMKEELTAFFSDIERSAEQGKFKYENWVKMIDDLSQDPTKQAFIDLFSAIGFYAEKYFKALAGRLRKWFGDALVDRAIVEARTEKTRQWATEQKVAYQNDQMPHKKIFSWIERKLKGGN